MSASTIGPFRVSPNPNLLYTTPTILSSLDKIRLMIQERQGLACILGDNGIGKSSVLRYLLAEYGAEDGFKTGLLNQTEINSPYALLRAICTEFDLEIKRSMANQRAVLEEWLVARFQDNQTVVLFVDEGQRLSLEQLEFVRSLLNFETYDEKLVQIVIAGTLDLMATITGKRGKAILSRMFAPCILQPLTADEMAAMIAFRCERAGVRNPFDDGAIERIYAHSQGVPRPALILCAHAYSAAKRMKLATISVDLIEAARANTTVAAATA